MNLNWYESLLYGLFSGLTDILPVCAQAHDMLLLKLFGERSIPALLQLLIHMSIFAALYYSCMPHITKMIRAKSLSRVPKRRRKRPLDVKSLMDFSLWKTMAIPVILGFLLYQKLSFLRESLLVLALFLFLNGLILYIPQYLPGSNKDSRSLSRVEGLLMGLGGALSVLPGISAMGACVSIGSVCGVDRKYCLTMAFLMNLVVMAGLMVTDVLLIIAQGAGNLSFGVLVCYLLSSVAAFLGTTLGIRVMNLLSADKGYSLFAYYSWGIALFTFILNLMA